MKIKSLVLSAIACGVLVGCAGVQRPAKSELCVVATGCVATHTKVKIPLEVAAADKYAYSFIFTGIMPRNEKELFKSELEKNLDKHSMLGSLDSADKVLEIRFENFAMRHPVERLAFGWFAGRDEIRSTVFIKDRPTGLLLGQAQITTENSMEVFNDTDLIMEHAKKMVEMVINKKNHKQ
ncbi:hypothetical protein [Parachitinimonas caeni]|uniref:Lipoprotein n=1 Tax=Parachitinimonas caeni TaxID=3031301 RepID=A0ABT7DYG4_9NEIS|nr:hypothetical protein [Parachitinimonas caeni]MDK2125103.1 hypothetical protein [Parachitinimonas caeni]